MHALRPSVSMVALIIRSSLAGYACQACDLCARLTCCLCALARLENQAIRSSSKMLMSGAAQARQAFWFLTDPSKQDAIHCLGSIRTETPSGKRYKAFWLTFFSKKVVKKLVLSLVFALSLMHYVQDSLRRFVIRIFVIIPMGKSVKGKG